MSVRVRFAPSPTGHLHVGGARTALFNWLFARHEGGRFVLRIEDTDLKRNVEGAEARLLEDLRWLGLDWDEGPDVGGPHGPYRQSERRAIYHAALQRLLATSRAYYAWDSPEELERMRRQAAERKETFRYPRPERFPTREEAERARAQGRPVVVRFCVPEEPITIQDALLGAITFPPEQLDDFVILKSDGWPTYHFAVVVDDAQMAITHVLRAQEHLMNTPRHVLLQDALGYPRPTYAHLPVVLNMDGSKMSKRDKHRALRQVLLRALDARERTLEQAAAAAGVEAEGLERWLHGRVDAALEVEGLERLARWLGVRLPEVDVQDFRASGYLPEALANFLALLGWSPGDDRELMSLDEIVQVFDLKRVNRTAGRFDRTKLLAMNTQWAARLPRERLVAAFRDYAAARGSPFATLDDPTLERVLEACRGFRTLADVERKAAFLCVPDRAVAYDAQAVRKVLERDGGRGYGVLERALPELEALSAWTAEALQAWVAAFCEREGLKIGELAQPLRVALTGGTISPAIQDTLALLGRERALERIRRCVAARAAGTPDTP